MADVARIDLVVAELCHNVRADAGVIDETDECRPQLDVCNVFDHIAAHAAVHMLHNTRVAPLRNIRCKRISLDIHKYRAKNNDAHSVSSVSLFLDSIAQKTRPR